MVWSLWPARVTSCLAAITVAPGQDRELRKKSIFQVDTVGALEYLASPLTKGTSGNDCSVQFFDNRIACDGPNAIPSHPGERVPFSDDARFP